MPERHLYEYAVIRLVPKVEREEFMNIGLILFSKQARFIGMRYHIDPDRLRVFAPHIDVKMICHSLEAMNKICTGNREGGPVASLEIPERFRWLTAVRSACIQTSRPHPGLTYDLKNTFDRLFEELVV